MRPLEAGEVVLISSANRPKRVIRSLGGVRRVRAGLAPLEDVPAIGRELLNAMVVLVHDVHMVFSVYGDTSGTVELAGTTAQRAPFAQECS